MLLYEKELLIKLLKNMKQIGIDENLIDDILNMEDKILEVLLKEKDKNNLKKNCKFG